MLVFGVMLGEPGGVGASSLVCRREAGSAEAEGNDQAAGEATMRVHARKMSAGAWSGKAELKRAGGPFSVQEECPAR